MLFLAQSGGCIREYSMCLAKDCRIFGTQPRRDPYHEQTHTLAAAKRKRYSMQTVKTHKQRYPVYLLYAVI